MPMGMAVILVFCLLAALGYLSVTIEQIAGVAPIRVSVGARVLGGISFALWIVLAICILRPRPWGWPVALAVIACGVVSELIRLAAPGRATGVNLGFAICGLLGSAAMGVYLYRQKRYFVRSSVAENGQAPVPTDRE